MHLHRLLFLLLLTGSLASCNAQNQRVAGKAPKQAPPYLNRLSDTAQFMTLSGPPLSAVYNNVASVKVVLNLRDGRLYFLNSARYRFHIEFCGSLLGASEDISNFNAANYGKTAARQFCLANLNYYQQTGTASLEFVSEDEIPADKLEEFYGRVRAATPFRDSLRLLVSSDHLLRLEAEGKLQMPLIHPPDLYSGQLYQPLNKGAARGRLRLIGNLEKERAGILPTDIVVLHGAPLLLPVCAGAITDAFQTPLSHINVLCHSRGIPAAVRKDIFSTAAALDGKTVSLEVGADSLVLSELSEPAPAGGNGSGPGQKQVTLRFDLGARQVLGFAWLSMRDAPSVGNKAAGLAELARLAVTPGARFSVPEGGFAIPFYFYRQHISAPAVSREIELLLSNPDWPAEKRREQLKRIREAIRRQPLDSSLLAEVTRRIRAAGAGPSYRFRSSSNAEDRIGFSGAGLYDSKTGVLDDSVKSIEKAIKTVWASTWDEAPYEERSFYHIDHRSAMMGVLCHRNFPDEQCNGVAITRNLYRDRFPGFTINVQPGEASVVSPEEGVTCEQLITMTGSDINSDNKNVVADYITFSSLNGGRPVLSRAQLSRLHRALGQVKQHFFESGHYGRSDDFYGYGLDLEFKFDRNGKLYLKQVRPYR